MISDQLRRWRLIFLVFLTAITFFLWFLPSDNLVAQSNLLRVSFLDVGQGDAIFIETPEGIQVLIDGGPNSAVLKGLSNLMKISDREIDLIIGTHPDNDHIGGLIEVLERYRVGSILLTENQSETAAYRRFATATESEGASIITARRGQTFTLGASTTLRVLFPVTDPSQMESNASSIILQLQYGEVEFMLTGDAPQSIEDYLVSLEGETLESEVLKLGHHGSKTSTSADFLERVDPDFAIVSAEADSRYGHPHPEVVELVSGRGIDILHTADLGTISFFSDGTAVWRE